VAAEMLKMPMSSLTYTDAEWERVLERIQPKIDILNAEPIRQRKTLNLINTQLKQNNQHLMLEKPAWLSRRASLVETWQFWGSFRGTR